MLGVLGEVALTLHVELRTSTQVCIIRRYNNITVFAVELEIPNLLKVKSVEQKPKECEVQSKNKRQFPN